MHSKEEMVEQYFNAWLQKDGTLLEELFDPDIRYSESFGPLYLGINQVVTWFNDWILRGCVLEWRIQRFIHAGDLLIVEWFFSCVFESTHTSFNGVSIIEFNQCGKMCSVKEFQSKLS